MRSIRIWRIILQSNHFTVRWQLAPPEDLRLALHETIDPQ